MGRKPRYTTVQMIKALRKTKGMVYLAADELGCSHATIYNYIKRHPTVAQAFEQERGLFLDAAEIRLKEAVFNSSPWAIRFALTMLGGDRGYAPKQRQEVTGPGGGPLTFKEIVVELPADTPVED